MAAILVNAATWQDPRSADQNSKHKHHREQNEKTATGLSEEGDPELRRRDPVFEGRQVQSESLHVGAYGALVDSRCAVQRWAKIGGGNSQEGPARRKALL